MTDNGTCKHCSWEQREITVIQSVEPWITIDLNGNCLRAFDQEYPGFIENTAINYCPMCGRDLNKERIAI